MKVILLFRRAHNYIHSQLVDKPETYISAYSDVTALIEFDCSIRVFVTAFTDDVYGKTHL